jgi:putative phosphoesterase
LFFLILAANNSKLMMEKAKVKIGVISDTHLSGYDARLARIAAEHFKDADLILHGGDLVDLRVLDVFAGIEVKAVSGNMDNMAVKDKLPEQLIFEVKGFKIGLIHGWGSSLGIEEKLLAKLGNVNCVVYGHTHKPANYQENGVLFFNPGSAVDKRFAETRTIGILEIDKEIKGRIISV